jgi:hypothetical protein
LSGLYLQLERRVVNNGISTVNINEDAVYFSLKELRKQVSIDDAAKKKNEFEKGPQASEGYGGKFGVLTDRMDKVNITGI